MLKSYRLDQHKFLQSTADNESREQEVWLDLLDPDEEEIARVERHLALSLPSRDALDDIELSNRFYEENGACFLTAHVVLHSERNEPELHVVLFVLRGDSLLSLRYAEPASLRKFIGEVDKRRVQAENATAVLLRILDALVARIADRLQLLGRDTDRLAGNVRRVVSHVPENGESLTLSEVLAEVNRCADTLSKNYQSLASLQLLLDYLEQSSVGDLNEQLRQQAAVLEKDLRALIEHSDFLSQKLEFLLESTLGIINIEQNNTIKMFSVLAMVFMPPTLIASLYGMNFSFMPELGWRLGYPLAVLLMVLSSLIPYRFFKRKGWL